MASGVGGSKDLDSRVLLEVLATCAGIDSDFAALRRTILSAPRFFFPKENLVSDPELDEKA